MGGTISCNQAKDGTAVAFWAHTVPSCNLYFASWWLQYRCRPVSKLPINSNVSQCLNGLGGYPLQTDKLDNPQQKD